MARADGQRTHRVALIEGDGIGPELVAGALAVLEAAQARVGGFRVELERLEGGAGLYRREGRNLSEQSLQTVRESDALLKGPTGLPDVRRPDGTEAGSLGGVLSSCSPASNRR